MKKIFTILFLVSWLSSFSTNYYFATSGNDGNAGTIGAPWQTISKFNSVFASKSPGDNFLFNRGDVFYGSMIISRSGSSGSPITIGAYGSGAQPVITGFTTVSAWTNLGSNIWESTSAISTMADMNMVVINGVNTAMGRTPNTGWYTISSHVTNTSITSASLNASVINWTGADVFMKNNNFAVSRNLVTSASGTTINYSATTGDNAANGYGFFIENDARTLDVQNEWYYSPSSKRIRIYSTSSPANVQVSTLDTLVYMAGKSNLTFDGIDFTGSNKRAFYISSCPNITIQNCNFNYHGLYVIWGGSNGGSASSNFNFNHNTVNHINSHGIVLQSEYVNPYIGYNTFKNIGVIPGMMKLILGKNNGAYDAIFTSYVNGLHAEYNLIDSVGYVGIFFSMGNSCFANNNEVSNHGLLAMDGGGIYTYCGNSNFGSKIYNNIVHEGYGDNSGTNNPTERLTHGIYLDGGLSGNTRNIQVYNNTCFNNIYSGIFSNGNSNCNFHDNTLYNNSLTQMLCVSYSNVSSTENTDTLKNNIFFSRLASQDATYFKTIWASPIDFFTNAGTCDSNYIARPIDDNLTVHVFLSNIGQSTNRNLAQWRTYSGYDVHSNKSPVTVTNVNQLRFEYATFSSLSVNLGSNIFKDVKNNSYTGIITIPAWTSLILINTGIGNILPTANAGSDQTLTWPTNSVSLSGSGSDADGSIVAYTWTKISGPASFTITNPNSQNTTVTGLAVGVYQFQLQVTDNSGGTATDVMQVTVNKGSATISLSALSKVYNELLQSPTVTTSPAGLSYSLTLDGVTGGKINAGSYSAIAGITDPNWNFTPVSATFTITKRTITINATNKTVYYDGNPQSITATTTPTVSGLVLNYLYNDDPVQPSAIGSYDVAISVNDLNNQATVVHVTLDIVSNPAIIFISDTAKIYNGSPQGVTVTSAYTYTVTYDGSATVPTLAGSYTAIATINDGVHVGADTAILVIAKQAAIRSWGAIAPMPYGSQLTATQLNASANISGTWSYTKNLGDILPIGTTTVTGTFTPTDTSNYSGGTVSQSISVYGENPFLDYFISGNGKFFFIEQ